MSWYKQKIDLPDANNPLETIYEIVTAEDGEEFGYAVADVRRSVPHFHYYTDETYTLLSGMLRVHIDGVEYDLTKIGQSIAIPIHKPHWAESLTNVPARIGVHTMPAWTPEDHILIG